MYFNRFIYQFLYNLANWKRCTIDASTFELQRYNDGCEPERLCWAGVVRPKLLRSATLVEYRKSLDKIRIGLLCCPSGK